MAEYDEETKLRANAVSIYRYIEIYEETKVLDKKKCHPSFTKEWNSNDDEHQWTSNHYFYQDKEEDDLGGKDKVCGVFLTSYQHEQMQRDVGKSNLTEPKVEVCVGNQSSQSYFKLHKPQASKCSMPPEVAATLMRFKKKRFRERKDCDTPKQILNALEPDLCALSEDQLNEKNLRHVHAYSKSQWDYKLNQASINAYKTCYSWYAGSIDRHQYELVLGLGHVRQLAVVNKKKTDQPQRKKIVNGPLIEILMDAKYNDSVITVFPVLNARVKWSIEARSVLVTAGGGNKTVVSELNTLVANADAASITPGDPNTYHDFLVQASNLSCLGGVMDNNNNQDNAMHALPVFPEELHLNRAWCLFVRRKRSNIRSMDAHSIAEALQERRMGLSPPLRALASSESMMTKYKEKSDDDDKSNITIRDYALPLRASSAQTKIIRKVLNKTNVVTTVQGPPGTGKTQTAVNIAGCELQKGSSILVTSVNPQSLAALVEKFPAGIRKFCIDMAGVERPDGGMTKLCRDCDCMKCDFNELANNKAMYEHKVEEIEKELVGMGKKIIQLCDSQNKFAENKRDLMSQHDIKALAQQMLATNHDDMFPLINALLSYPDIVLMCETYADLIQGQEREAEETVQVVHDELEEVDGALLVAVTEKEQEASSDSTADGNDWLNDTGGEWDELLESVRIDNGETRKSPESVEEWARVKRHLVVRRLCEEFYKNHVVKLVADSQLQAGALYMGSKINGDKTNLLPALSKVLTAELKQVSLSDRLALQDVLGRLVEFCNKQEQISSLKEANQERQTELAINKIAQQQIKSLTQEDKSHLNQFTLCATKLKTDEASKSTKMRGKELRKHEEFKDTLRKCLDFIPLLVMTEDQVNTYVPVDHQFDLVLVDEASLSNPTAVTLMPRGKQFVVIGDDKQVSPSDKGFSEDAIDVLEASLPEIRASNQLKPGNSLFNICQTIFPDYDMLYDHFRCPSDAIAWTNKNNYYDKMKVYKPTTGQQTAMHVRVEGGKMNKKSRVNEKECEAITEFVYNEIEDTAKNRGTVNSIGIICMTEPQRKRIQEKLDEELDRIRQDYCSETVSRHDLLVGDSVTFQGHERDIMGLSCVHDEVSIKPEMDQESLRKWNVSTTRCKKKLVMFHSFDKKHLKKQNDHKRDILDHLNGKARCEPLKEMNRKTSGHNLRIQAREKLSRRLKQLGFKVNLNHSNVWNGALSIGSGDTCALVHIENYGETLHEWSEVVNDHLNLEGAGTSCMRVDTLALAFMFLSTVDYIIAFLEKAGLQPTTSDAKLRPIIQTLMGGISVPVLSDPSDSDFDSQDSSAVIVLNQKRKRKRATS